MVDAVTLGYVAGDMQQPERKLQLEQAAGVDSRMKTLVRELQTIASLVGGYSPRNQRDSYLRRGNVLKYWNLERVYRAPRRNLVIQIDSHPVKAALVRWQEPQEVVLAHLVLKDHTVMAASVNITPTRLLFMLKGMVTLQQDRETLADHEQAPPVDSASSTEYNFLAQPPPYSVYAKHDERGSESPLFLRSQRAVIFPLVNPPYGLKVVGRENLEGITGPVLFASNHNLGLDNPLIIKAVPLRWRRRMAVVGAADLWKNPVWWIMKPLLGNAFPLAREGSVRPSLAIMDNGWSVLIYPEGELTVGGPIKPFMNGTGLVAVEGRIPVVPLRLYIHELGFPTRFPVIRRGRVEVRLGEPLSFSPGTNYQDATSAIEKAVKSL